MKKEKICQVCKSKITAKAIEYNYCDGVAMICSKECARTFFSTLWISSDLREISREIFNLEYNHS